jgi:hypothetical protein
MHSSDEHEVVSLIVRYGFDLGGHQAAALVRLWGSKYDQDWLLPAAIETLNRGRYKVASIEQILQSWQRQGKMTPRFTLEFAEMVLGRDCQPELEDEQEAIDGEIYRFSDKDIQEAHQFANETGLSEPALDEEASNWDNSSQITSDKVSFKSGLGLTASSYPPSKLRKPGDEELSPHLPDTDSFEPSAQVSQFYYRLLQMANTSPTVNAQSNLAS